MGEFVRAASMSEIAPETCSLVVLKGKEIVLFNVDGEYFALDNLCTHEEGPLCEGEIEGHEVTCPWHGARFDIRTGEVLCDPAYQAVERHKMFAWSARTSRSRSSISSTRRPQSSGHATIHMNDS